MEHNGWLVLRWNRILVTANIRNASVRAVLHGMLRKGLVFVPALISAR